MKIKENPEIERYIEEKIRLSWSPEQIAGRLKLDNGVENVHYQELGIDTYFCHPYHSWEKGSIEYVFKLIREYIPKKARLTAYTDNEIAVIINIINNRPRKCLGYRTP